jgi:hypothetical protein
LPVYEFACPEGHHRDAFFHVAAHALTELVVCVCGAPMEKQLSLGRGLTYFVEGRPRVIENLGPEPVTVRRHEEHKRLMREHQVDWATAGTGRKGCWT